MSASAVLLAASLLAASLLAATLLSFATLCISTAAILHALDLRDRSVEGSCAGSSDHRSGQSAVRDTKRVGTHAAVLGLMKA